MKRNASTCPVATAIATRRTVIALAFASAGAAMVTDARAAAKITIGDPPPDKGQIIFFRPSSPLDAPLGFMVREGKVEVGQLSMTSYFIALVDPGLHTYSIKGWRRADTQVQVEAGETYYLKYDIEDVTLTPTDQRTFDEAAPRLHQASPPAL